MKLLILAAGYATRLYPLTLNKAKPLLDVGGKPMIEHVLDTTRGVSGIDAIYVVSNEKFSPDFEVWAKGYRQKLYGPPITVVNDHSTDDSNKLGAIGDIRLVIDSQNVDDDLMIIGGDNLFNQKLDGYAEFARANGPTLGVYNVGDLNEAKKYGCVEVENGGRIKHFIEKPPQPQTTLVAMCLYYYPKAVVPLITQYLKDGNNPDQPGRFVQWLYTRQPVFAYEVRGKWMDIGSHATYELANREFGAK